MKAVYNNRWIVSCSSGIALYLLLFLTSASADTHYVWTNGAHNSPFTGGWTDAATNIQAAVDQATSGDTVLVTNGTYTGSGSEVVSIAIDIELRSVNGRDVTIIDAEDVDGRRVFSNGVAAAGSLIHGFTITGGKFDSGLYPLIPGAGVWMDAGTVSNCTITGNSAYRGGGGAYVNGSGALVFSTVHGNSCGNNSRGGAGIWMDSGNGLVEYCTITNNTSAKNGGGLYIQSLATGSVRNCLIANNSATGVGAGVYIDSSATVQDCIITNNITAGNDGGGIYTAGSGQTIRNCLVANNRARRGGGMRFAGTTPLIENCTVVSNTANYAPDPSGGGLSAESAAPNVRNTIVYFNTNLLNSGNNDIEIGAGVVSSSCSPDLTHDPAGTGNITNNPQFVDFDAGNYRLEEGSPCVDAGTNQAWMATATDLDGILDRIIGDIVDMGAYETGSGSSGTLFLFR